jgi:Chaperone of endosialidase
MSGSTVVVNSSGQLGVMTSSARYKRDIRDMGAASGRLMKLRRVTFRYRADAAGRCNTGW